jgi:nitrate/nitrite transporter NarK
VVLVPDVAVAYSTSGGSGSSSGSSSGNSLLPALFLLLFFLLRLSDAATARLCSAEFAAVSEHRLAGRRAGRVAGRQAAVGGCGGRGPEPEAELRISSPMLPPMLSPLQRCSRPRRRARTYACMTLAARAGGPVWLLTRERRRREAGPCGCRVGGSGRRCRPT